MADFPSINKVGETIRPSSRSITPGNYPVKIYRSMSGKTVRRSMGSLPTNFVLNLEFQNVPDATMRSIVEHYNQQYGSTIGFSVPTAIFSGMSVSAYGLFRNPSGTQWFYAEPPQIETVANETSTISVSLVAELI